MLRACVGAVLAAGAAGTLVACGSAGRPDPTAAAAATDAAGAGQDWAAVCTALSPGVRDDVAGDESCAAALAQDQPVANGPVTEVQVVADQAVVRQHRRAMFLEWGDGLWWVTGLDCHLPPGDDVDRCSVKV